MGKGLEQAFSKEDIQIGTRYMKRCSISLITVEMQIKTTVSFKFTTVAMAIIKKTRAE